MHLAAADTVVGLHGRSARRHGLEHRAGDGIGSALAAGQILRDRAGAGGVAGTTGGVEAGCQRGADLAAGFAADAGAGHVEGQHPGRHRRARVGPVRGKGRRDVAVQRRAGQGQRHPARALDARTRGHLREDGRRIEARSRRFPGADQVAAARLDAAARVAGFASLAAATTGDQRHRPHACPRRSLPHRFPRHPHAHATGTARANQSSCELLRRVTANFRARRGRCRTCCVSTTT